ncbi:hypothetical protein ABIA35_006403 [Catenulispora sp. MAP12-49]|uniref:hypothetical protein n=1 Tax=Catenulispora sp. MAP12-49 TaxID=3156302 RepID=UPI0035185DB4
MADESPEPEKVELEIHEAAREGALSAYLAEHPATASPVLYRIVADVVYERLTRRLERGRGHHRCAVAPELLLPECHDGFQDDVEAVLADLVKHADRRIGNLGGWMAARLNAVTVDANRRRRGERGALQRPRLPAWLGTALGPDPWLRALALDILMWVGVPTAVAGGLWPLGTWADRRAAATGDSGVTERQVATDVELVLSAMRTNPDWYEQYVERPLGRKQAPPACAPRADREGVYEPGYVSCAGPDESVEANLRALASEVIDAVEARMLAGDDPRTAVVEVLGLVFGVGTGSEDLGCAPGCAPDTDERVARLLADPEALDRVVEVLIGPVLEAMAQDGGGRDAPEG